MSDIAPRLFVWLQHLLPKYWLTAIVRRLARIEIVAIKNFLIRRLVGLYEIDTGELTHPVPDGYPTLNAFFTRELAPGARPIDPASESIVSPVDGTVSAAGPLDGSRIIQAKGFDYSLTDLLAVDTAETEAYAGGAFATLYLAPYNYHRVHAPIDGELVSLHYVPGDLYSVNDKTVRALGGLFVRNERVVCRFETPAGPMAFIFVGALNVGTINTRWTGDLLPKKRGVVENIDVPKENPGPMVAKGDTLGWFNMGSTVILVFPAGAADDLSDLESGQTVRVGERIAGIVESA